MTSRLSQKDTVTCDEIEEAYDRVLRKHTFPYEHAIAIKELMEELGICPHEDYAYNGGKCTECGKQFEGAWI